MQKLAKQAMDFARVHYFKQGNGKMWGFSPLKFHFYNSSKLCYMYKHAVNIGKSKASCQVDVAHTYIHKECML